MNKIRLSVVFIILLTAQISWADTAKHFQILSTTNVGGETDPCG